MFVIQVGPKFRKFFVDSLPFHSASSDLKASDVELLNLNVVNVYLKIMTDGGEQEALHNMIKFLKG